MAKLEETMLSVEKKADEVKNATTGEVKKVEKCANCVDYRADRYSIDGKCLRQRDSEGNFLQVKGEENYCEKFDAMPEDKKEGE